MEKEQFKMIVMATMGWRSCKTNYLIFRDVEINKFTFQ